MNKKYLNNRFLENDDQRVIDWKEQIKEIEDNKTASTVDNLKKNYFKSKSLMSMKKFDSDFQFVIVKKMMVGNVYDSDFINTTCDLEPEYFETKSKDQIMSISWEKNKNVTIKTVNNGKIIISSIRKKFFGSGWKYQVTVISREPITYWTLKSSVAKINLKRESKYNIKSIVKKLNKAIKFISDMDREEILKLDFNNINYGKN